MPPELKTILLFTTSPDRPKVLKEMGFEPHGLCWTATINNTFFRMGRAELEGLTQEGWVKFISEAANAYMAEHNKIVD